MEEIFNYYIIYRLVLAIIGIIITLGALAYVLK